MIYADIGRALKERLSSLTFAPAIPVAWPNRDFVPATDRWIVAQIERVPNERLTIGGKGRWSGSLIITVVTQGNRGSGEGEGIADAVCAHFPADLRLSSGDANLRVTANPSIRQGFLDGGYWRTPVIVPFEVLT